MEDSAEKTTPLLLQQHPGRRNPMNTFWGKFKPNPGSETPNYLPLSHHCLDVAVVFRHLVDFPTFQRRLMVAANIMLTAAQLDRLAVLALLHDFGKANLGFQGKVFDPKAPRVGHVFETAPLFQETLLGERLSECLAFE